MAHRVVDIKIFLSSTRMDLETPRQDVSTGAESRGPRWALPRLFNGCWQSDPQVFDANGY